MTSIGASGSVRYAPAHQTGLEPPYRILYGGILSRGGVSQPNTISLAGLGRTPLRSHVVVCHSHQPASDAIPPIQPAYACRAPQLLGIFFPSLGEQFRENPRRDTPVSYLKSQIIVQMLQGRSRRCEGQERADRPWSGPYRTGPHSGHGCPYRPRPARSELDLPQVQSPMEGRPTKSLRRYHGRSGRPAQQRSRPGRA